MASNPKSKSSAVAVAGGSAGPADLKAAQQDLIMKLRTPRAERADLDERGCKIEG